LSNVILINIDVSFVLDELGLIFSGLSSIGVCLLEVWDISAESVESLLSNSLLLIGRVLSSLDFKVNFFSIVILIFVVGTENLVFGTVVLVLEHWHFFFSLLKSLSSVVELFISFAPVIESNKFESLSEIVLIFSLGKEYWVDLRLFRILGVSQALSCILGVLQIF
jgi:hypothetical protein